MLVAEDLNLDVPRPFDVFLDVDASIAEGRLSLGRSLLPGTRQREVIGRHPHALAAAAGRGLQQDWEADLLCDPHRLLLVGDQAIAARNRGHARLPGQGPGGVFIAHEFHRLGRGADEADVARAADLREVGVF